jgi:hypothetical protein
MKSTNIRLLILILPILFALGSCKEYLEMPVEADIPIEKVFATYNTFQGYIDQIQPLVLDHYRVYYQSSGQYGGECLAVSGLTSAMRGSRGEYNSIITRGYYNTNPNEFRGIWTGGWRVIRMCNVGLENLDKLIATPAQKDLIKGQLLFFRAYFHFEMLVGWGPIPYVNKVLVDDLRLPRYYEYKGKKNYQATTEYIVEDLLQAAELLPIAWPDPSTELGRPTALAAHGYVTRALLYAGSPLMNENSGNAAVVNKEYMQRAALQADYTIKLAEAYPASYGLTDGAFYSSNFYSTNRVFPWTKEVLWSAYRDRFSQWVYSEFVGDRDAPNSAVFGGGVFTSTPTQNYIDKFEMEDGTLYNPEIHDNDNDKRWAARDPRLKWSIYFDRDFPCTNQQLKMFKGGATISTDNQLTPYILKKYWAFDVSDKVGKSALTNNYSTHSPLMRLADVYLMYAEAANWAYGDGNNGDAESPGASYSALEAVNLIRQRIGHVPTTATGGAHGNFHKMILNERAVELCFESNFYWVDIRRYKIGETLHNTSLLTMDFNEDWTNFQRREVQKMVFEKRNYWLPFPSRITYLYPEFPQNEGWE